MPAARNEAPRTVNQARTDRIVASFWLPCQCTSCTRLRPGSDRRAAVSYLLCSGTRSTILASTCSGCSRPTTASAVGSSRWASTGPASS